LPKESKYGRVTYKKSYQFALYEFLMNSYNVLKFGKTKAGFMPNTGTGWL